MTRITIARFDLMRTVSQFCRTLGIDRPFIHARESVAAQDEAEPEVTMTMETVVQKLDRLVSELAELRMQCTPAAQKEHPKVIRSPAARKKFKTRRWQEKPFCEFCDKELLLDEATIDHMLPKCRGGDDADDNLVVCCEPCNSTKGSMTATEFEQAKRAGLHVQSLRRTKKALASFKKRHWERHPYCEFCDKVLSRDEALLDRKVPLGRGGGDYGNNLILCCEQCQSSKGELTADEYRQSIWLSQLELPVVS